MEAVRGNSSGRVKYRGWCVLDKGYLRSYLKAVEDSNLIDISTLPNQYECTSARSNAVWEASSNRFSGSTITLTMFFTIFHAAGCSMHALIPTYLCHD